MSTDDLTSNRTILNGLLLQTFEAVVST